MLRVYCLSFFTLVYTAHFNDFVHGYSIHWHWANWRYKLHDSTTKSFHIKNIKKNCGHTLCCDSLFVSIHSVTCKHRSCCDSPSEQFTSKKWMNRSVKKLFTLLLHNNCFASHSSSFTSDTFISEMKKINCKDELHCGCHWLQNYRPYWNKIKKTPTCIIQL